MSEITRGEIVRVGVDLAKHFTQVHAVDQAGRTFAAKPLPREKFLAWCTLQLLLGCLIAMRAAAAPTTGLTSCGRWALMRASLPALPGVAQEHVAARDFVCAVKSMDGSP